MIICKVSSVLIVLLDASYSTQYFYVPFPVDFMDVLGLMAIDFPSNVSGAKDNYVCSL